MHIINMHTMNRAEEHMQTLTIADQPAAIRDDPGPLQAEFIKYLDSSPRTVDTYKKAIKQFFIYLKQREITQPGRDDVIAYREELRARGCRPTTIQNYIIALRLFFDWCEASGLYPNIARHVKGAKLTREHKKDALTADQVKMILDKIDRSTPKERRDYALFALMVSGGLRDIEAQRANIEDLRTLGGQTVLYLQGKGRDERAEFIKIVPEVEQTLRDMLADRKGATGKAPLFCCLSNNGRGGRLTTRSISGIIKSLLVSAGFSSDRLTAHSLRHTAVTLALQGGVPLEETQQFARHANIATTQIYAHNLDRINNKSERAIARAIFN